MYMKQRDSLGGRQPLKKGGLPKKRVISARKSRWGELGGELPKIAYQKIGREGGDSTIKKADGKVCGTRNVEKEGRGKRRSPPCAPEQPLVGEGGKVKQGGNWRVAKKEIKNEFQNSLSTGGEGWQRFLGHDKERKLNKKLHTLGKGGGTSRKKALQKTDMRGTRRWEVKIQNGKLVGRRRHQVT